MSRRKPYTAEYTRYKNTVHRLSKKTYQEFKHDINPNDYTRAVAGVAGGYHLDHKTPIKLGFLSGIAPEKMAIKENLQMLPWRSNVTKGSKL